MIVSSETVLEHERPCSISILAVIQEKHLLTCYTKWGLGRFCARHWQHLLTCYRTLEEKGNLILGYQWTTCQNVL